jgi:chromosome partitioning protein
VLNAVPPRGPLAEEARAAIAHYGVVVTPVHLGQRSTYVHALTAGQAAQEYEPQGKAAEEITRLYRWTCQQVGLSSWRRAKN